MTNLLWPTIRAFYYHLSTSAPIFSFLKLHEKERNWNKDLRSHLGMELNLNPSAEIGTDFANPCGSLRSCGVKGAFDRQRLSGLSLSTSLSPFSATALPYTRTNCVRFCRWIMDPFVASFSKSGSLSNLIAGVGSILWPTSRHLHSDNVCLLWRRF